MPKMKNKNIFFLISLVSLLAVTTSFAQSGKSERERTSINEDWSFFKYESAAKADKLIYDVRREITDNTENKVADAKPTEAIEVKTTQEVLKAWILPSGNDFIKDPEKRHARPKGNPGEDFQFVKSNFDDGAWENINLPHDWAIKAPFRKSPTPRVGGGLGCGWARVSGPPACARRPRLTWRCSAW